MKLDNRIVELEVKLKYMERLLYVNMLVIASHIGITFIPLIWAFLP